MKRNILQEYFNFASGTHTSKEGNKNKIIYIDPKTSEEYMPYAKDLKYKFGAQWIGAIKAYGWWMNKNQEATLEKIKKCMTYLFGVEKNPDNVLREVDAEVVKLLDELDNDLQNASSNSQEMDDQLLKKVEDFKMDIIEKLNSPKVQAFVIQLQLFRHELAKHSGQRPPSLSNAILIWMHKPNASEVRPRVQWEEMKYEINKNAVAIPQIGMRYRYVRYSKEEREKKIADYLRKHNTATVDELQPSAKYDLKNRVLKGKPILGSESLYNFVVYDISDVTPLEGAETQPEEPDDNWWWQKTPEDEKDRRLCDALMAFAQTAEGGSITFVTNQKDGSARGWSSADGTINTQADGYIRFPTMVHELTHSLRHWAFSSEKNPQLKKFYRANLRDIQEQEADLCAAFVSASFGYDNSSNVNYVYNWGLTKDNVSKIFDEIAYLADYIEQGVRKYLK